MYGPFSFIWTLVVLLDVISELKLLRWYSVHLCFANNGEYNLRG